jgi:hypothetical protein
VLAYELLAGRHPFAGKTTAQQLLAAHLAEAPRPLTEVAPAVPRALAALVMRCLAKDAGTRPATAAELVPVLTDAVASAARPDRARHAAPVAAAGLAAALHAAGGARLPTRRLPRHARNASPVEKRAPDGAVIGLQW